MTDNLTLWKTLGKTDPAHTKKFSRPGGFKGTSLKPQWAYKLLTEHFGPVGVGWGSNAPSYQIVNGQDGEVVIYCTVECWHTSRENTFHGVGGDKAISKRGDRMFTDDEAFKKAHTDAVMNAFKLAGVGADIHMGQHDDDKYVEDMEREFAAKEREQIAKISDKQQEEIELLCDSLNFPIARVLEVKKITDLRDLPANSFEGAKTWITNNAKQKEDA